jgi:hypothetical protein
MSTHDIKGLLRRLEASASPSKAASGVPERSGSSSPSSGVQRPPVLTAEELRFKAYWQALERAIPEPPLDWEKRAKPPGSAPRTCGNPAL